uniref:Uncharacterized protein n=1 Tax=Ditylenchus dipsaci TaxID=166011 RepID=A0A915E0V9_9BILA
MKSDLFEVNLNSNYTKRLAEYKRRLDDVIKRIPGFSNFAKQCSKLSKQDAYNISHDKSAKRWRFNENRFRMRLFQSSPNKCSALRDGLAFADEPLSEEEKDFPLAYGFLVYKSTAQIFLLLSAIYQPQMPTV